MLYRVILLHKDLVCVRSFFRLFTSLEFVGEDQL